MARLNYVELPVQDIGEAKAFYARAFGFALTDFGPGYAATISGDTDIGLNASEEGRTAHPLAVLDVADIAVARTAVEAAGGRVVLDIFAFPGGRRFHFTDPAGNLMGVVEADAPSGSAAA